MKTKNIIIIAIMAIFSTLNLSAQETNGYNNEPFLKEGRVWNCYRGYTKGYIDEIGRQKDASIQDYYFYTLNGDTLINGQEYMKLFKTSKVEYEDEELHYFAAVREDGDRVFIIYDAENEEILLYDFCTKEDGEEFVCGKHTFYVEFQGGTWDKTDYHALYLTSERIEDKEISIWGGNSTTGEEWPMGPCDFMLITGYGIASEYDGSTFDWLCDPFNIEDWFHQYKPRNSEYYTEYTSGRFISCHDGDKLIYDNTIMSHFFEVAPTPTEPFDIATNAHIWALEDDGTTFMYFSSVRGSTEINNTKYQKLFLEKGRNLKLSEFCYRGEENKVYRYNVENEKDELAYDFDLTVGDRFTTIDGRNLVVVETGDTCGVIWHSAEDNGTLRFIKLRGVEEETVEDCWVEGVGSLYTGFFMPSDFDENTMESHLWFEEFFYNIVNTDALKANILSKKPLSSEDSEDKFMHFEFNDDVLYITGRQYMICSATYVACEIKGDKITVRMADAGPLANCYDWYNINAEFSGFKQGTYKVIMEGMEPLTVTCGVTANHPQVFNDGDCWVEGTVSFFFNGDDFKTGDDLEFSLYKYFVDGYTDINGKEYKRVHCTLFAQKFGEEIKIGGDPDVVTPDVYFVREDGEGRQWLRWDGCEDEQLMWDFSAGIQEGNPFGYGEFWDNGNYHYHETTISKHEECFLYDGSNGELVNDNIVWGYSFREGPVIYLKSVNASNYYVSAFLMRSVNGNIIMMNEKLMDAINAILGKETVALLIRNEMVPTDIECIEREECSMKGEANAIYDLTGRKFQSSNFNLQTTPGIYIWNGRKVLVK